MLYTKNFNDIIFIKYKMTFLSFFCSFLVGFAPFVDGTVISPNTDGMSSTALPLGSAIVR